MPFLVVTAWFPIDKGTECAEKYIVARKQFPPDRSLTKEILQGALKVKKGMVKNISVSEVKPGKLEEALLRQQESMLPYHDIDGYEYKIDVYFNYPESFNMIGMTAPE